MQKPLILWENSTLTAHGNDGWFGYNPNPLACTDTQGESESHRRGKTKIYEALLKEPGVEKVVLEGPLGSVRPDVSAYINGVHTSTVNATVRDSGKSGYMPRISGEATIGQKDLWLSRTDLNRI